MTSVGKMKTPQEGSTELGSMFSATGKKGKRAKVVTQKAGGRLGESQTRGRGQANTAEPDFWTEVCRWKHLGCG